jgi:hypothetical protein
MRRTLAAIAVSAAALLGASSAARADCVPSNRPSSTLQFILGIEPSDTPLDVWCRLQTRLPAGDYEMNIYFGGAKVGKTTKISFNGSPSRSKEDFAVYLQSLLPTSLVDVDEGNAFPQVLEHVVQAQAARAQDGSVIALPAPYARSAELVLWEPMSINVKEINLGGVMFKMYISFRPSAGQFFAGLEGKGESLVVKGWHDYVLRHVEPVSGECNEVIPACTGFGDNIPIRTAWILDSVTLVAEGKRLSEGAYMVLSGIEAQNKKSSRSSLRRFDPTVGAGAVSASMGARSIEATAFGAKDKTSGTSKITVVYKENPKDKTSYRYMMDDYAEKFRNALIRAYPDQ